MLLLVAVAWIAGCAPPAEPTPHIGLESAASVPTPTIVSSPPSAPSPTSVPPMAPTSSPTAANLATATPVGEAFATPTPSSWSPETLFPYSEPSYPCGPDASPYRGGVHRHFLHWQIGDSGVVFDLAYATWAVNAEGTAARRVADADPGDLGSWGTGQYGYYADVSPGTSRIAYSTCEHTYYDHSRVGRRFNRGYEIATVNADGSGRQRLTDNVHFENYPVWSPDGNRIAFIAHNDVSRWADYFHYPDH